ncbi:SDR family oxidoreductase [Paraburkholderia humisilvae]|uniref:3-phenylpropionate-dihydrodiol/cinnamic acid-dihydrodiol dehydrogenase n=1 Tax=Paraburkholderia humisilvae TaxID=627669 RepID=A0A6J5D298_9BURK|nr:SDR family oxidoreductase [Paraburkholderia humisilvae]CAB3748053.1 3-phenylpropionate-dihydrodiol/cinnamic acid-dihydrodiol dehydrogenase [Paraburkholderia humisilvae]
MTKSIFITGASSGLGRHTAIHFAQQGWNVAATMRDPDRETELAAHERIRLFKLDVTDPVQARAAVHAAVDAFGDVEVVVNNAGVGSYGPLEFAEEDTIDWQFAVNVRGPINVIRAFLPHFRERKGGRFINISSFMGVTTAVPTGSLYNMSKFALEGLTEGLYYELKPFNIELHLVEPGGFKGNRFVEKVVFNTHPDIRDYDPLIRKVNALMKSADESLRDDPQWIVDEIDALATGRSDRFRTLVGKTSKDLMQMRASMPIEDYLATIAANFA